MNGVGSTIEFRPASRLAPMIRFVATETKIIIPKGIADEDKKDDEKGPAGRLGSMIRFVATETKIFDKEGNGSEKWEDESKAREEDEAKASDNASDKEGDKKDDENDSDGSENEDDEWNATGTTVVAAASKKDAKRDKIKADVASQTNPRQPFLYHNYGDRCPRCDVVKCGNCALMHEHNRCPATARACNHCGAGNHFESRCSIKQKLLQGNKKLLQGKKK